MTTYHVGSISLDRENNHSRSRSDSNSSKAPEQRQAVKHLAELLASLISQIESLSELGSTGSVNSANVFYIGVDSRTERGTHRKGGNSARCRDLEVAEEIDEEEFTPNGEGHGRGRHSEKTNGRVVRTGAAGDMLAEMEKSRRGDMYTMSSIMTKNHPTERFQWNQSSCSALVYVHCDR
jgi:hypothetical protein